MLEAEEHLSIMAKGHPPVGSPTISRAAAELGVSVKTIRNWIKNGVIPEPPTEPYGRGTIMTFPAAYLVTAKAALDRHRKATEEARRVRSKNQVN